LTKLLPSKVLGAWFFLEHGVVRLLQNVHNCITLSQHYIKTVYNLTNTTSVTK